MEEFLTTKDAKDIKVAFNNLCVAIRQDLLIFGRFNMQVYVVSKEILPQKHRNTEFGYLFSVILCFCGFYFWIAGIASARSLASFVVKKNSPTNN